MPETLTDAQKVLRNDTGIRMAAALEALASEVEPSTVIAPEYDETQTYAVGDLVMRRSVLYRCTTPIPTPEAWTAEHWTETSVSDEYRQAADQDVIDANLMALGLTGASVGDLVRVAAVDTNGKPTSWQKAPLCDITTNPNLLDNWLFTNPVNQRGQTTWQNAGEFTVDRWKLTSGTASLGASGLTLNGTLVQKLETAIGQPVTCSALLSDGSMISPTYDDSTKTFTITATGQTIKAAKLEISSDQTLAHQEGGVWVLNEIPDWAEEMAACQRYYFPIPAYIRFNATYRGPRYIDFSFSIPVRMIGTMTLTAPNIRLSASTGTGGALEQQDGFAFSLLDSASGDGFATIRSDKSGHGLLEANVIILQPYTGAYLSTE